MRFKWPIVFALFWITVSAHPSAAQSASNRYALILEDPPVSERYTSRETIQSLPAKGYQRQIEARQQSLRRELTSRNITIAGSTQTLLNAVFVVATKERESELKSLPGVKAVVLLRRYHLNLNRATPLVNAPAAWSAVGGEQNAGSGTRIAILDTGIDQTHPAFQDPTLPTPDGFPICSGADCSFTNNKVIVARSYVRQLAAGSSPDPAADSRPDDYSARDRVGHGTAVASAAGGVTNTGAVTITGMAPKAYLGNYKIFGSPQVNDGSSDDVIISALEDALNDGMHIASLSVGGPAFSGPLDSGSSCGNPPGVACDLLAQTVENAAKAGMTVVVAAGNDGDSGNNPPTFNTISSPADAPSAIAAGATTNSHVFVEAVRVPGSDVPSGLQQIAAQLGDGFIPSGAVTAPLRDATQLGNDGLACSNLPAGSLVGAFVLIERGSCPFSEKLGNAQNAGAAGVIFYMADASSPITPGGLAGTNIPAVMISNSDGVALKSFIDSHPDHNVTIDPAAIEKDVQPNLLANFSSLGPSTGDSAVKPDLVAVGTNMYMAAGRYDPLGDVYSANGYAEVSGTSFSTPLTAGAAALVKQAHPDFMAAQIKSALVNTASQDVTRDESGNPVGVQSVGGGKLDAGAAVNATVTSNPATVSFGVLGSLPVTRQFQITNNGSGSANLTIAVTSTRQAAGVNLSLDKQSLALAPGASATVSATLSGTVPSPGSYDGAITIQGSGASLRIPYLYLVGSGAAANMIPLTGDGFDGTVGEIIPDGMISFKLVDAYGVPVAGAATSFRATGGGTLRNADTRTDGYGIATAEAILGSQPGNYSFVASAGGLTHRFTGTARLKPTIASNGIVDAASWATGKAVAPGSYIAIFGTGLSDDTAYATTSTLPLAIDHVNVSFDAPSAGISVPGHLTYVSSNQVNVQVPWELQGQSSAQVKVTIDFSYGNVYTLSLSDYAPAFFEFSPGSVAAVDLKGSAIGSGNPAHRGDIIQLFANGLGPVTNQPASGEPAPFSPLAETVAKPTVTIGGKQATVSFSGLTPGFPGLYQMNVTVPSDLSAGAQPITLSIGGQTAKSSGIVVQ